MIQGAGLATNLYDHPSTSCFADDEFS